MCFTTNVFLWKPCTQNSVQQLLIISYNYAAQHLRAVEILLCAQHGKPQRLCANVLKNQVLPLNCVYIHHQLMLILNRHNVISFT